MSGGTDNHLVLVDLTEKGVNGAQAQAILEKAGITVNKNSIPFDPLPPGRASGIRIGAPAVTTRKMGPNEMKIIAGMIDDAIASKDDEQKLERIKAQVRELCGRFQLYGKSGSLNEQE